MIKTENIEIEKINKCNNCTKKLYTKEEKENNLCSLCISSKKILLWKEQLDVWRW